MTPLQMKPLAVERRPLEKFKPDDRELTRHGKVKSKQSLLKNKTLGSEPFPPHMPLWRFRDVDHTEKCTKNQAAQLLDKMRLVAPILPGVGQIRMTSPQDWHRSSSVLSPAGQ
jgi:hypothetical protein